MKSRGSPWQYVRFFLTIVSCVLMFLVIRSGLRPGESIDAFFSRILNSYHLVTDIYLEYSSTTYHFYGESLEPAKSYLSLLSGGFSGDKILHEMDVNDGAVFAKVWYYIDDTLLFSITILGVAHGVSGAFIVEKTTGSRSFATAYVDGTDLRVVINSRRLNINNLVSLVTPA